MNLEKIVRENIWQLKPYSCARDEFSGEASVWLDANESPYNNPYNRYPDPLQSKVKAKLAGMRGAVPEQMFLGVGSDECIDTVYRVFCNPGIDNVVAIAPSYGMYEVCADINDVAYRKAMLTEDFDIDIQAIFEKVDQHTKVVWICSPNNPTGNAFSRNSIEAICAGFAGIVVVDEAYIDFSDKGSMVGLLYKYPNLIVLQTMSKAWGSASIRLGIAFASPQIIAIFNKVKYPYNINLLTQNYALEMLNRSSEVQTWVDVTIQQRQAMAEQLAALPIVEKIFPSDANFLLARVTDADGIYNYLCKRGIVVRNRNNVPLCKGCIRFTVGTAEENTNLINALSNYGK